MVVAPAGSGKTAVLAEWATTTDAGVAWLACDQADGEPSRFWSGLIAATTSRWPGVGDDAALVLQGGPGREREMVASLSSDLADIGGPAVIVVDDAQFARAAQPGLFSLAQALPSRARLVLGSRRRPGVLGGQTPPGRGTVRAARRRPGLLSRRGRGAVRTVGLEPRVPAISIACMPSVRAGRPVWAWPLWPCGAPLTHGRVIDALASTTRAVSDYLLNEVLERLPADLVEFMTTIAVFEEFDASLCQAVTGEPDAGRLLEELVSAELFVVPVGDTGQRFRFHHLFGAFLRARLRSFGEDRLREAQQRAIAALEERGERLAALRLAVASGDTRRAATVVTATISSSLDLSDSQVSTMAVRAWLREYGLDAVRSDPEQLVELVLGLAQMGKPEVEGWLARVQEAHPDPDPSLSRLLHGTWAEYLLARGDPEEALPHNQRAAEANRRADRPHPLFVLLPVQRGRGYLMAGDMAGLAGVLESVSAPIGAPIVDEARLPALRAWVALQAGELRLARRIASEVLDAVRELGAPPHGVESILATVVDAAIDLEAGNFASAERLLGVAETAAQNNGKTGLNSLVSQWFARLATARGYEAAASSYLTEARFAFPAPSPIVRAGFAAEELRQAIVFSPERGTELLSELPDRVETQLLGARLAIAQGNLAAAETLLATVAAALTTRERVELGVLRALVAVDGDAAAAHAYLREALRLGRPEGFYRTVLEQGSGVSDLLGSFSADGALAPYVGELVAMAAAAVAPLRQGSVTEFVEQLSPREVTVLRYLPSRLTNQEIAAQLFVSRNTLKTHQKRIYRKLGADLAPPRGRHRPVQQADLTGEAGDQDHPGG